MQIVHIAAPSLGVSGGIHVLLRWAESISRAGYNVIFTYRGEWSGILPFIKNPKFQIMSLEMFLANQIKPDVTIIGFWSDLLKFSGKRIFLAQGLDVRQINSPEEKLNYWAVINKFKNEGGKIVAIAPWLGNLLNADKIAFNGIEKALFNPKERSNNQIPFLLEGSPLAPTKNLLETAEIVESLGLEYSVLTQGISTELKSHFKTAKHIFRNVPYNKVPLVMKSHKILIKLSESEGFSSTVIEHIYCGGGVLVFDTPGMEEFKSAVKTYPQGAFHKVKQDLLNLDLDSLMLKQDTLNIQDWSEIDYSQYLEV